MKGILVILSAPSGAGKTTIIQRLLQQEAGRCVFAISHTTRPPRNGEVDGREYHFVDDATFARMVDEGAFVEWAWVHSNRYGTSAAEVERLTGDGLDVVFDVDFQGARALMRRYPDAASIFVLPPSLAEAKRRLAGRATDDEATIRLRLDNARVEIATAGDYRYCVVNDDVDRAVEDVRAIVRAERLRAGRAAAHVRALAAEKV
jgi:guanylate kinase